jgi:hypothetical protein
MKMGARPISGGRAQGELLLSRQALSFLGGVDRATGRIQDPGSDVRGSELAGRIFAFPHGKGSTVGSYVVYGLKVEGMGPAAIVNERAEAIVATGAIMAEVPMVDGVDLGVFCQGDRVAVDGDEGWVDIEGVEVLKHVVTSFLENRGDVLVLKRSDRVGSFQGYWAGVSGYLEPGENPEERARMEILEETGVRSPRLVRSSPIVHARGVQNPSILWAVHPFLWHVDHRDIQLDWEHIDHRWIRPEELGSLECVPNLERALHRALGR